jgi:type I restriction enzyme M protein
MPKRTTSQTNKSVTTAQRLGSVVKSARDIMRKDKGMNGELDRLPQFTWILFLKLLDDVEKVREAEAFLQGTVDKYKPLIESPYRWRDWAADDEGMSDDDLLKFINNDEVTLRDGTKSPGLFAYLRSLQSATGGDRKKEDTKDLLSLGHNLTFSQLSITQENSTTFIRLSATGEIVASLNGVSSTLINVADFG